MELELYELEFYAIFFFLILPIAAFLMELELHELEFHAIFFFFIKFDRPILDFLQIEFYIENQF